MKFDSKTFKDDVKDIFTKKSLVDITLNYDVMNQKTYSSSIVDAGYKKQIFRIFRPRTASIRKGDRINLSTRYLSQRIGLDAIVIYSEEQFILAKYVAPITNLELRRSFRTNPNDLFYIKGRLSVNDFIFEVPKNTKIVDLSAHGIGFLSKGKPKELEKNLEYEMNLVFQHKKTKSTQNIITELALKRIKLTNSGFIHGYEFINATNDDGDNKARKIANICQQYELENKLYKK